MAGRETAGAPSRRARSTRVRARKGNRGFPSAFPLYHARGRTASRTRGPEQLIEQGLAERRAQGIVLARNLIGKLRDREVHEVGERLASETGRTFSQSASGEYVTGTYRQRMVLTSGRYAMIDDGLQFQLVPWTPSLEKQNGRHVSGVARDDGGIDWSFTRNRGLGL